MCIRSCRGLSASGVKLNHKNGLSPRSPGTALPRVGISSAAFILLPPTHVRKTQMHFFIKGSFEPRVMALGGVSGQLPGQFHLVNVVGCKTITTMCNDGNKAILAS